jgi:hypothetical protein
MWTTLFVLKPLGVRTSWLGWLAQWGVLAAGTGSIPIIELPSFTGIPIIELPVFHRAFPLRICSISHVEPQRAIDGSSVAFWSVLSLVCTRLVCSRVVYAGERGYACICIWTDTGLYQDERLKKRKKRNHWECEPPLLVRLQLWHFTSGPHLMKMESSCPTNKAPDVAQFRYHNIIVQFTTRKAPVQLI